MNWGSIHASELITVLEDPLDFVFGIVACVVLTVLGRYLLSLSDTHRKTLPFQIKIFLIAMFARFGVSLLIYQFGYASVIGDYDASGWQYGGLLRFQWVTNGYGITDIPGQWWAHAFSAETSPELGFSNHPGYYYLLATVFYLLGGESRMVAAALNCFFGALTVVLAYRTAASLFTDQIARRVAWWTCLFPSMIIWAAQTVKEPVVILLEMAALYGCIHLKRSGFALRYVLLCGLAVVFVTPFRFYAAYIGLGAIAISIVAPSSRGSGKQVSGSAMGMLVLLVSVIVIMAALAGREAQIERFDVGFIERFRHDIAAGAGSGVTLDVDMRTTTGFSLATLVGAAHLALAPFPWQLGGGSVRMAATLPELLYWWWLFFFGVLPGLKYLVSKRLGDIAPVLFFVLGLGLLYSMMFGNVGLVFRQRAQLLPWMFMFASVGLELRLARFAPPSWARPAPAVPPPIRPTRPAALGPRPVRSRS